MSVTTSSFFIPAGCGMSVALEGSFSHETCGFCISQTWLLMPAHELIIKMLSSRLIFIFNSTRDVHIFGQVMCQIM
jgi:hypothetical protein